jgi:hypothetical protein
VGFDYVSRGTSSDVMATWIVFKPSKNSGTVINVASTNWCATNGIGTSKQIQQITLNMILKLLNGTNVFSPPIDKILNPYTKVLE